MTQNKNDDFEALRPLIRTGGELLLKQIVKVGREKVENFITDQEAKRKAERDANVKAAAEYVKNTYSDTASKAYAQAFMDLSPSAVAFMDTFERADEVPTPSWFKTNTPGEVPDFDKVFRDAEDAAFNAPKVTFVSDSTVTLIDEMASDKAVVEAARVSTLGEKTLPEEAAGLINFLMRDRHGSPFEHAVFKFRVTTSLFVWREHMRHRMVSYNEQSGRYMKLEPVFYVPPRDRPLVQQGKPGAYTFVPGTEEQVELVQSQIRQGSGDAYARYDRMLRGGIAREVAREILPLNMMSSAIVTINARSLMNFISLRTKDRKSVV